MENNKTPSIRFKGFTDPWEQRKLGDTNTFFTDGNYGKAYPKASDMTDSSTGIPFLTGGNLKNGRLDLSGANYITYEKHMKLTSGHLAEDDIVIAVRGSLGALGYVNKENSGWNINSQLAILRTDKTVLIGKYLIQFLLSTTGQKELLSKQTGSALKQLPISSLKDIAIPITSIEEQERIGMYLQNLDNLITLHQRKYNKLLNVKKSMLEKMFPKNGSNIPEIRFKGFTDPWEQRKLGDQMFIKSRIGWQALTKKEYLETGDYYLITGTDIDEDKHIVDFNCCYYVSKERYEMDDKIQVYEGDIIVTKDGTIGKVAMVTGLDKPATLNSHLFVLRDLSGKLYNRFLLQVLVSHIFGDFVESTKTGSTLTGLPQKTFVEFRFLMPEMDEQMKIAQYLDNLDNLITLHQRELEKLQYIKKSMLEKMFV